jgi:hypothetical protein
MKMEGGKFYGNPNDKHKIDITIVGEKFTNASHIAAFGLGYLLDLIWRILKVVFAAIGVLVLIFFIFHKPAPDAEFGADYYTKSYGALFSISYYCQMIYACLVVLIIVMIFIYTRMRLILRELSKKAAAISVGKIEKSLLPENNDDAPYKENKL